MSYGLGVLNRCQIQDIKHLALLRDETRPLLAVRADNSQIKEGFLSQVDFYATTYSEDEIPKTKLAAKLLGLGDRQVTVVEASNIINAWEEKGM